MEWISVNDKLPEEGVEVIACNARFRCIGYIDKQGVWRESEEWTTVSITHWIPLPEPPKQAT